MFFSLKITEYHLDTDNVNGGDLSFTQEDTDLSGAEKKVRGWLKFTFAEVATETFYFHDVDKQLSWHGLPVQAMMERDKNKSSRVKTMTADREAGIGYS